jgi:hypothetical protein
MHILVYFDVVVFGLMKATIESRNKWPPCFWQTGYVYCNTTFIIFWNLNHKRAHKNILSCRANLCGGDKHLGDPSSKLVLTPGILSQGFVVFVKPSRQIFGHSTGPQPHPVAVQSDTNRSVACKVTQFTAVVTISRASRVLTESTGRLDSYRKYRVTQK